MPQHAVCGWHPDIVPSHVHAQWGWTPLMYAVNDGNMKFAMLLLDKKAAVDCADKVRLLQACAFTDL